MKLLGGPSLNTMKFCFGLSDLAYGDFGGVFLVGFGWSFFHQSSPVGHR